jgi:subtilisin family serine protease
MGITKVKLINNIVILILVSIGIFYFTKLYIYKNNSNGLYGWPVNVIDANQEFPDNEYSSPPLIAIIDSGIVVENPYINRNNITQIVIDKISAGSSKQHGTMVAGLIIGNGNGYSTPGGLLPNAKILSIQSGTDIGMTPNQLAYSIKLAVERGAKIINISFGTSTSTIELKEAVKDALSHGAIIVAAAGNEKQLTNDYPAAYPGVIAVSILTKDELLDINSNFDSNHHIAAPGVNLLTTGYSPMEPIKRFSGSSAATPLVSSTCAIIISKHASWTSKEMNDLLVSSSRKKNVDGRTINILDVKKLYKAANVK